MSFNYIGDDMFVTRIPRVREKLLQLKESMDELSFIHLFKHLQYNIPLGELQSFLQQKFKEPDSRDWAEWDPIEGKLGGVNSGLKLFRDYIEKFPVVRRDGYSFVFYGPNSSGKTYLALWMMAGIIELWGRSAWYMHFKDYMNLYNEATFRDGDKDLLKHIYNCEILVMDEIGKESKASDNVVGEFEHLLKYRETNCLPTILITNMTMSELEQRYRNSIRSLLDHRYRFIQFSKDGEFRKNKRLLWEI